MGQIKLLVSFVMIVLFGVALITFAVNFAVDNDSSVSLADDSDFPSVKTGGESNIEIFYSAVNTSTDAMYKSTISIESDETEGGTAFKVGPAEALGMATTTMGTGFSKIFGSDSGFEVFFTALLGMLGVISIMYIWKAWRGNPD